MHGAVFHVHMRRSAFGDVTTGIHSNFQSFMYRMLEQFERKFPAISVLQHAQSTCSCPRVFRLQVLWSVMKVAEFTGLEKTLRVVAHAYGRQCHRT